MSSSISGERFTVVYKLSGTEAEALSKAKTICLEQTIEFPEQIVPKGIIQDHVVGRVEKFTSLDPVHWLASISYAIETAQNDLPQLLNVIFGNSSIKPGIRVENLELPLSFIGFFTGPRFGRQGLRNYLKVQKRPLLCTALKPLGLSAQALADLAYQFAKGGIDIIKDDHGLADQVFAPFQERTRLCAQAVQRANQETGQNCIYAPNLTAPDPEIMPRARYAKKQGAGGLLIAPGLTGLDTMRALAADDSLALPIFAHPALQGTYVLSPDHGISHAVLFGQLARLAGADATIFPNFGGRFSFSREECQSIAQATEMDMGPIKPIFPTPGGGMSLERIPEMLQVYGQEVIFLIGGGLFTQGPDIIENCRYFRSLVE